MLAANLDKKPLTDDEIKEREVLYKKEVDKLVKHAQSIRKSLNPSNNDKWAQNTMSILKPSRENKVDVNHNTTNVGEPLSTFLLSTTLSTCLILFPIFSYKDLY